MEEVFNARLIADEAKALVDEKASDCSRRHTVTSDVPPGRIERREAPHGCGQHLRGWLAGRLVRPVRTPVDSSGVSGQHAGYGGTSHNGPHGDPPARSDPPLSCLDDI